MKERGTLCPACSCILGYTPHSLWCTYERTYEQPHAPAPRTEPKGEHEVELKFGVYYRPEHFIRQRAAAIGIVDYSHIFELALNDYDFGILRGMHIAVDWKAQ